MDAKRLAKDPSLIYQLDKPRRTLCIGGCGRYVWSNECRKCRAKRMFKLIKNW